MSSVTQVAATPYLGVRQEILKADPNRKEPPAPPQTWMEDAVRSFVDANQAYARDDAMSRISSGDNPKVAWSSLASQNQARFDEMSVRVSLDEDKIGIIRASLLVPTVSTDGKRIREQQSHARLFLRTIVVPLLSRVSNNILDGHADTDRDARRLNAIMGGHEPGEDCTILRSTLASYGNIRSGNLLMLAQNHVSIPVLESIATLRASVQLLVGVALTALWQVLAEAGGGPLGSIIVKPLVLIALERLAISLKFARADDDVTRLIQDQREDQKIRKMEIYKRIMPDDIEFVKELRLIKKDFDWDQIEREYATQTDAELGAQQGVDEAAAADAREQEVGALGAYPDDDREVAEEDADQEIMDYVD